MCVCLQYYILYINYITITLFSVVAVGEYTFFTFFFACTSVLTEFLHFTVYHQEYNIWLPANSRNNTEYIS